MNIMTTPGKVLYNLGPIKRLPIGEGRTFQIDGEMIAIFRTRNNEIFATQAACPHKAGPLADGLVGDGHVICPLHAYKFRLATGESVGNTCSALKTYTVVVTDQEEVLLSLHD